MASESSAASPGVTIAVAVKSLRQNVVSFWRQYGHRFETWWRSMDAKARHKFVLEYTSCMPESPDSSWGLTQDGKREDASGSLQLLPELNMAQLAEDPEHLLGLFRARVQHAEELVALEREHGFHMFQGDLEWKDLEFVSRLHAAGVLVERSKHDFYIVAGDSAGRYAMKPGPMPASLQSMFDKGIAVAADVADTTLLRQSQMLTTLTVLGDGYRQDVLGKEGSKYTATSHGCAYCAAMEREGGGKLLLCASCGVVAYCSRACQVAHWKEAHKKMCRWKPFAADASSAGDAAEGAAGTKQVAAQEGPPSSVEARPAARPSAAK